MPWSVTTRDVTTELPRRSGRLSAKSSQSIPSTCIYSPTTSIARSDNLVTIRKTIPLSETSFANASIVSRSSTCSTSDMASTNEPVRSGIHVDDGDDFNDTLVNALEDSSEFSEKTVLTQRTAQVDHPASRHTERSKSSVSATSVSSSQAEQGIRHQQDDLPITDPSTKKSVESWMANKQVDIANLMKMRDFLLEENSRKEQQLLLASRQYELAAAIMGKKSDEEKVLPETFGKIDQEVDSRPHDRSATKEELERKTKEKRARKTAALFQVQARELRTKRSAVSALTTDELVPSLEAVLGSCFEESWEKATNTARNTQLRMTKDAEKTRATELVHILVRAFVEEKDPYVPVGDYYPPLIFALHSAQIIRFHPKDPKRACLAAALREFKPE